MKYIKDLIREVQSKSRILFAFSFITLVTWLVLQWLILKIVRAPETWIFTLPLSLLISSALVQSHNWLDKVADKIFSISKRYYKSVVLLLILAGVWYGFIRLVEKPPLDTTSVMVMVWATAMILILALFPSIIDLIKKIKIGDIEIELKDVISKSSPQDYITATEISGTSISAQKGDARNLQALLTRMMQEVGKPILLTVNLERTISKTFLFVYVFLIELFSSSIIFFVSRRSQLRDITDLKSTDVLGLISGQKLINAYLRRFPSLIRIFTRGNNGYVDNAYESIGLVQIPSGEIIDALYGVCRRQIDDDLERETRGDFERNRPTELLNKREVENWFGDKLNSRFIDKSFGKNDLDVLRQCILSGDDFVILTENKKIVSVTRTEDLTRNISKNLLTQITGNK